MAATVCNWCIDTDNFTNMPTDPDKLKAMTEFATQNGMTAGSDLGTFLSGYLTDFASQCTVAYNGLQDFAMQYISSFSTGCTYAFALACVSLIVSFLIYILGRKSYAHIIADKKKDGASKVSAQPVKELTPQQTKQRVVALLLVFAVVIFFWMVFHQNGQTLTEFAKSCTSSEATGWTRIGFNIWAIVSIAGAVYSIFGFFQSSTVKGRAISGIIFLAFAGLIAYFYSTTPSVIDGIDPAVYQQFNPFYVVALTPFSMAIFAFLGRKGKEPSAPRKIGYGMVMAAIAYGVMVLGSLNLVGTNGAVSPNWLISTYLLLTFAELLLSPMGISFVSKVAPPKLKGSMMGGWFAATAIGNYLVSIPMILWGKIPVAVIWGILIVICLISAAFIFSIMKKLEAATSDDAAEPVADALETVEDDAI